MTPRCADGEAALIQVVAPAGPPGEAELAAGLAVLAAIDGLALAPAAGIVDEGAALPYLAHCDAARVRALSTALADASLQAVFCARGGYGCLRLMPALAAIPDADLRVPLVGFSDCTVLHAWLARRRKPSIHGPVVTQLPKLPASEHAELSRVIRGRTPDPWLRLVPCVAGVASGPVFAGNLAVLTHLLGTPYFPDLAGHVLVLEEINEAPYAIDRMLTQLRLSGVLAAVAGIAIGQLIGCDQDQGRPQTFTRAQTVFEERLAGLGVPLVFNAPIGHGHTNRPVPLGATVELDAHHGTLHFLERS